MDYTSFLPEDFICDESFQHFCMGTVKADIIFWQNWILNHPQKKVEIEKAIRMVNMLNANQGNLKEQNILLKDTFIRREKFRGKVFGFAPVISIAGKSKPSQKRKFLIPAAAASLALLIFSAVYWFQTPSFKAPFEKEVAGSPYYSTGEKPRNTILLPDGSLITLASNSKIKLVEGFSARKREVTLSGEGYFAIKHDASSPFIVHTSRMELVVLGTIFNVKDFEDSSSSEAFLISGKLRVSAKQDSKNTVVLKPNESVVISGKKEKGVLTAKKESPLIVTTIDSGLNRQNLAWIHNRLSIDDEPLSEIATRLQEWYGIEIRFADETVKNYRYSGTFESETVMQALQALQLSYPFHFTTTPREIIISK